MTVIQLNELYDKAMVLGENKPENAATMLIDGLGQPLTQDEEDQRTREQMLYALANLYVKIR